MPSIIVYVDDSLYKILKELSTIYGMRVTDLVKVYIKRGVFGDTQKILREKGDLLDDKRVAEEIENAIRCIAVKEELQDVVQKLGRIVVELKNCAERVRGKS